jgi:pyridoxine 5-phosphate synthase
MPAAIIHRHTLITDKLVVYVRSLSEILLDQCKISDFQVNIVFTDDDELQQLNHRYRNREEPTNVLSFPFDEDSEPLLQNLPIKELGDIVISVDRAQGEAVEFGLSLKRRLAWLMIHGLLHLLRYDHEKSKQDAESMYAREEELLEQSETLLCLQIDKEVD